MKRLILLCTALSALCLSAAPALAGQTAITVRPTELKANHYSDSATLLNLPQNTQVEIIGRHGSWNRVKVNGKTGWVKMLSLRLGAAPAKSGDNGYRTLFNVAATGGSSSTTTGVRGLSEEKLKNPHPNPQELEKLHRLQVSKTEAEQFARAGKLVAQQMDYLPNPGK